MYINVIVHRLCNDHQMHSDDSNKNMLLFKDVQKIK